MASRGELHEESDQHKAELKGIQVIRYKRLAVSRQFKQPMKSTRRKGAKQKEGKSRRKTATKANEEQKASPK